MRTSLEIATVNIDSTKKGFTMVILLALLLILILAGAGFALHVLWIVAVVFAIF